MPRLKSLARRMLAINRCFLARARKLKLKRLERAMNEEPEEPQTPKPDSSAPLTQVETQPPSPPLAYWLRRFLACNPFYLVSAALLLYGFYRVSVDPTFLSEERAQLTFNFTSLQFYELLLVITAIFLARRRIWYDSALLVGLENLLVLVPFILISQAGLIGTHNLWPLCVVGGLLAILRFCGLKLFIAQLDLPARLLPIGLIVLTVNAALPVVYRLLHEHKIGTKLEVGAAYYTNEYIWLLLVPALCALANLLPATPQTGDLRRDRPWFPLGFLGLWLLGTGVHLYCLGYVYDFSLRPELLAPATWVLLWSLRRWVGNIVPQLPSAWQGALLIAPLLATLAAASQPTREVFLLLTIFNAAIYGGIYFCRSDQRLALHLLFISLAALIGGWPEDLGRRMVAEFSREKLIGAAAAAYFLLCAGLSRNPKLGLLGALVSATVTIGVLGGHPNTIHSAAQIGFAFLLLHSLRWDDLAHSGAAALRLFTGMLWVADAWLWIHAGGMMWMACAAAGPVVGIYLAARFFRGCWGPRVIPIAALLVMLASPGESFASRLQATPVGLLAVVGSFLLFGLGTLAAVTKHRWNKAENDRFPL